MAAQAKKTVAKKAPAKKTTVTKTARVRKEADANLTPKQRASNRMKAEVERLGFTKKPTWNENYADYVAWRRKNPKKTER